MLTLTHPRSALTVRQDLQAVRETLYRIRECERLAPLNLFGQRSTEPTIDYLDRRHSDRLPVEMPIYLTEVGFDGEQAKPMEDMPPEVLAFTKDVSLRGIGFKHDGPVEADYAVVTFDLLNDEPVSLLLDVRWSNLERGFRYLSGGRFIGIVENPKA